MPTDHDLLIEIATLTRDTHRAIFGNGRPGLLEEHAGLQEEVSELKRRAPTQGEKRAAWAAIAAALITAFGGVIATMTK